MTLTVKQTTYVAIITINFISGLSCLQVTFECIVGLQPVQQSFVSYVLCVFCTCMLTLVCFSVTQRCLVSGFWDNVGRVSLDLDPAWGAICLCPGE